MQLLFKLKQKLGFCCAKGCWHRSKYVINLKTINEKREMCEEHLIKVLKILEVKESDK